MSSILPQASRYANSRHSYSFPRISGFLFDGSQSYDFGNDGEGQTLGGCSVRVHLSSEKYGSIFNLSQANVRRTNVATKLKVTYVKGSFLDVKVQYKACRLALKIYYHSTTELSYLGDDWSDCFYVENITLPNNVFLGFSAMTGDVSDAHEYVCPPGFNLLHLLNGLFFSFTPTVSYP